MARRVSVPAALFGRQAIGAVGPETHRATYEVLCKVPGVHRLRTSRRATKFARPWPRSTAGSMRPLRRRPPPAARAASAASLSRAASSFSRAPWSWRTSWPRRRLLVIQRNLSLRAVGLSPGRLFDLTHRAKDAVVDSDTAHARRVRRPAAQSPGHARVGQNVRRPERVPLTLRSVLESGGPTMRGAARTSARNAARPAARGCSVAARTFAMPRPARPARAFTPRPWARSSGSPPGRRPGGTARRGCTSNGRYKMFSRGCKMFSRGRIRPR